MKTSSKETKAIKNEFNETAARIGCKARIGGNAKKPEFQMYMGDGNGYEIVVKIDAARFGSLINNYPELH